MAYTIEVSPDGCFLVITVRGSFGSEEGLKYTAEAHALGARLGIDRVLVDVTGAVNSDVTENSYDFAYRRLPRGADHPGPRRIATLVSPDDHSHDFVLLASQNAGFNVRSFRDRAAAESYLRAPDGAQPDGSPATSPPFYSFGGED